MEAVIQSVGLPLIAVLVPMLVALVKKVIPDIPKMLLPIIAAAFGPGMEALLAWVSTMEFTGIAGVAMGLAGVGIRELKDQVGKTLTPV